MNNDKKSYFMQTQVIFVAEQNIFKYIQHKTARIDTERFYCKCIHFKVCKEPLLMYWYDKHRKFITNRAPCYVSMIQFLIKSANYGNKNVNILLRLIFNFLSLMELQSNVSLCTLTRTYTHRVKYHNTKCRWPSCFIWMDCNILPTKYLAIIKTYPTKVEVSEKWHIATDKNNDISWMKLCICNCSETIWPLIAEKSVTLIFILLFCHFWLMTWLLRPTSKR